MSSPIRVLHIVNEMDRGGGIETWLMHVLRRLDPNEITFDFAVETGRPGAYDGEIRERGGRIIPCGRPGQFLRYGKRLAHVLRRSGPFDVVHSHVHVFSGVALTVAAQLGVSRRLAHGHTDRRAIDRMSGIFRSCYRSVLRAALRHHMTEGFAVSDAAALDLFGASYASDGRVRVLPCAIDYSAFRVHTKRSDIRSELAIAASAKVIGHVGRFVPSKNHQLLIDAFAVAARLDAEAHLLLVGDGDLRSSVEQRVRDMGLYPRVTFAGLRNDVPRMLTAMDVFAFPSTHEGLGLALIEAQAAGLPVVVSDSIPGDALISNHWVRRIPLFDRNEWAAAMLEAAGLPREARHHSISEKFDIDHNLRELMAVYRSPRKRQAHEIKP